MTDNILVVDYEMQIGRRNLFPIKKGYAPSFREAVTRFQKEKSDLTHAIVQYIDPKTGDSIKGKKFDTTTQSLDPKTLNVMAGVKIKDPIEPTQYEPRDRFQETNMKRTKFSQLVKECLDEIKLEKNPRLQLKEALRGAVREVLSEISNTTKPEPSKEEKEKVQKGFAKNGNERLDKENVKLQKELETLVHGINPDWLVYWDDHNELNVDAKNLLRVRITPKFENNFDIDAMVKLVDRLRVIAVTWQQVKDFVKANFSDLTDETSADVAKKKSLDAYKDNTNGKDAGPRHDITKIKKVGDTKKDNMDFNKKDVEKEEDQPDQPMKEVDVEDKNKNIEKTPHVKPPKHKSDDKANQLKTDLPATKKFRAKKS